ncbi:MAG TPA: hypothetical protein VIT68_02050 [Candidatus Gracilibacteria bacterium]
MNDANGKEPVVENPFAAASVKEESTVPVRELDTSLLEISDETDEDPAEGFFWVFQRILWGVLKSLIILLVLLGIIWMIWGVQSVSLPGFAGDNEEVITVTLPKNINVETTTPDSDEDPEATKRSWWGWFSGKKEKTAEDPLPKDSGQMKITLETPQTEAKTEKVGMWGRFTGWVKSFGNKEAPTDPIAIDPETAAGKTSTQASTNQAKGNVDKVNQPVKTQNTSTKNGADPYRETTQMGDMAPRQNLWITSSGKEPLAIDLRDHFHRRNLPTIKGTSTTTSSSSYYDPITGKQVVIPSTGNQGLFGGGLNGQNQGSELLQNAKDKVGDLFSDAKQNTQTSQTKVNGRSDTNGGVADGEGVHIHLARIERLIRVAESLGELMYERDSQSLVGQTVEWLRAAKQFSLVETQEVSTNASASDRAQKIADRIQLGELLLSDSKKIQAQLTEQIRLWSATRDQNQIAANDRRKIMYDGVENYQGFTAENAMQNVAAAEQNVALSKAYLEMYESLLRNVQNFDRLMRGGSIRIFEAN